MDAVFTLLLFTLYPPVVLVWTQWTIASAGHVQKRIGVQKLKYTCNCVTISGQFELLTPLYSFEGRTRLNIWDTKKISEETERRLDKGTSLLLSNSHHVPSFNFRSLPWFHTKTATLWRQLKFVVPSIQQSESFVEYWSSSVLTSINTRRKVDVNN